MASYNIVFLFILVSFFCFATTEAQNTPVYLDTACSSYKTTANSTFQFNLRTLLSYLSSKAAGNTQFYNTTVTSRDPFDSVYGLFMCRGDIPSKLCQNCVINATQILSSNCSMAKEGVIWYEECMVRYSNHSFFSKVDTIPSIYFSNNPIGSYQESFKLILSSSMNETAVEAARAPLGEKKFATRQATVSGSQTFYCLAQCTPDLSPDDCRICLDEAIEYTPLLCGGNQGCRLQNPSCSVMYEFYPFYLSTVASPTPTPELVPATTYTSADSEFSEEPVYLSHNC